MIHTEGERMIEQQTLPLVLKADDVQRILGISRVKVYELLHQQGFPTLRVGRSLRIPRDAFLKWMDAETDKNSRKD
jgi:excisionase family DNA binding protein